MQKKTKTKRITITALAKELGLSVTTVSFVLNGRAEEYGLAADTVARVKEAAREMNYVPNELARGLRQKNSGIIGVDFPHLRNNWAHTIMNGMYDLFEDSGHVPFIINHRENRDHEARQIERLLQRRADAFIINPVAGSEDAYRQILEQDLPLVFFSDALETMPEVCYSAWDPEELRLAVEHLVDTGRCKIAFVGTDDSRVVAKSRLEVFKKTIGDAGLKLDPSWIVLLENIEEYDARLTGLFAQDDYPDALFCVYDDFAIAAVEKLPRLGKRIPEDVAVATLGESRLVGADCYNITTVAPPVEEEGRQAALLTLALLKNPDKALKPVLVTGGRLIVRGSTQK